MKIEQITAINFLGLKHVELNITSPINVFVGPNGSGKSSLKDAIKAGLTGKARGLVTKDELGGLVREGSDKCSVGINSGQHGFSRSRRVQGAFPKYDPALDIALDSYEFINMNPKQQVTFLQKALLTKVNPDRFKGLPEGLAKIAMETGFKKTENEAITKRREVKRVLAGLDLQEPEARVTVNDRVYDLSGINVEEISTGLKRLRGQRDELVRAQGRAAGAGEADRISFEQKLEALGRELGELQEQHGHLAELEKGVETIRVEATTRRKVVRDLKKDLDAAGVIPSIGQFKGQCPIDEAECPRADELKKASKEVGKKVDALQKLRSKYSEAEEWLADLEGQRAELEKELTAVKRLPGRISEIQKDQVAIQFKLDNWQDPEEEDGRAQKIEKLGARVDAGQKLLRAHEGFQGALDRLTEARKKAEEYQAEVELYDQAAKRLGPDGIVREILGEKIGSLNGFMDEIPLMANVHFEPDLSLKVGKIPFACLSRSERFRAGIMAQVAICRAVEVKLLVIDEADVLDQSNRGKLLACLFNLLDWFDTVFVFSTVAQEVKPSKNPELTFWWIEDGKINPVIEIQAAA